jgi:hypothetical protein
MPNQTKRVSGKHTDRLFVPLSAEPYMWFETGKKRWELRRYGRQYTEKNVYPGRRVELRCGYSNPDRALWGTIVAVAYERDVKGFFDRVPFKEVIPSASSPAEAITMAENILNLDLDNSKPVLGFQVTSEQ